MLSAKPLLCAAALMAAAFVSPAQAACPDIYNALRREAYRGLNVSLTCDQVRHAARQLPLRARASAAESFSFAGEEDLREQLRDEKGIRLPLDILVLGAIERKPPVGPRVLILFAQYMPMRVDALVALAETVGDVPRARAAHVVGRGIWYDRIGFYVADRKGKYPADGQWLPMRRGGLWGRHQPRPWGVRTCLPCTGWLCPEEPLACFSDFNDNQLEEIHVTDDCSRGWCGLALLEPGRKGKPKLLLNANLRRAEWRESAEGWALLRKPSCRPGKFCADSGTSLGNPNCTRPEVLLLKRGGGAAQPSKVHQDRYYSIRHQPWPLDCRREKGPVELVYNEEDGFILYEK